MLRRPSIAQQRRAVAFDIGREDAGRCARRALSRRARLEDVHARAGLRELIRDGAADNARADDDDRRRLHLHRI